MKRILFCSLLITALAISGCTMRLIPKEMERVDQELTGNRGVIMGEPTSVSGPSKKKSETRTVYDLEIEFSSPVPAEQTRKEDTMDKYGNRGYLQKKTVSEKDIRPVEEKRSGGTLLRLSQPEVIYQKPAKPQVKDKKEEAKTYVVQNGDTLQKISEKTYGTTKKWKAIYEANKDKLKSPDKIRAGQKLIIP